MADKYQEMPRSGPSYYMNDANYSKRLEDRLDAESGSKRLKTSDIFGDLESTLPRLNTTENDTGKKMNIYTNLFHANNLRMYRNEVYGGKEAIFNKTFRFGLDNKFGQLSTTREFVFFTKPDLHIMLTNEKGEVSKKKLNPGLTSYYWTDMRTSKSRIIECLQSSYSKSKVTVKDPFNHLLQNCLISAVEVPSLNSTSIETSTNTYGVSLSYRGSSEDSDDGPEFSLEFKDDRYLNVYNFFRAFEEYETLKKHGIVAPQRYYTLNKILHDQFAIYKFIVDEDMETIIYWGKYYGVYPTSLPRDTFSSNNFQEGLSFSINFKAAFYEDMKPEILFDFNNLSKPVFDNCKYRIDIYNDIMMRHDGRAAKAALVYKVTSKNNPNDARAQQNPNGYYYKLVWKGDDTA